MRHAVVACLTSLIVCTSLPAPARAGPLEVQLAVQLDDLEVLLRRLDQRVARFGTSAQRVWWLHERLVPIEHALGLPGGTVRAANNTQWLLRDAANLGARVKAVILARAARAAPAEDVPGQGAFVPQPPDPDAAPPSLGEERDPKWPERLSFNATGKIRYRPFGEWLFRRTYRSSWGPDFLQAGFEGAISISLRAVKLVRQVKSADVRVVVRLEAPFAHGTGSVYRVFDLRWDAERSLWNNALKTWLDHDRVVIRGPYAWITSPREESRKLDVEAHVISVTLRDGEVVRFRAPQFIPR